jgi:hypothetical protein
MHENKCTPTIGPKKNAQETWLPISHQQQTTISLNIKENPNYKP